ncbi:hypothetical protein OUZ56_033736 [Daphnia magna]|uniref:Uncharacterized protein n=1 Tax=Daphnia magna TaxID=35525 RepID=A0ABR0BB06_9CRUS|nr:hypothetical protein OUZ56_033736 [Daphnia magna]
MKSLNFNKTSVDCHQILKESGQCRLLALACASMRRSNRLDFTKREETRNAKGNDGVVIRRLCHPTCIEFQSIEPQLYRWIEFLVPRCQLSNAGPVTLCKFNADRFG